MSHASISLSKFCDFFQSRIGRGFQGVGDEGRIVSDVPSSNPSHPGVRAPECLPPLHRVRAVTVVRVRFALGSLGSPYRVALVSSTIPARCRARLAKIFLFLAKQKKKKSRKKSLLLHFAFSLQLFNHKTFGKYLRKNYFFIVFRKTLTISYQILESNVRHSIYKIYLSSTQPWRHFSESNYYNLQIDQFIPHNPYLKHFFVKLIFFQI